MSFIQRTYEKHRGIALVLVAVAGGACGLAVTARDAAATTCAPTNLWRLNLESIVSSDVAVDHRPLWPTRAYLTEGGKEVVFTDRQESPGGVRTVKAPR